MMDFAMTTELQEVLQEARQISINFGHYYIHTHHLLAAMLQPSCLASTYLQPIEADEWNIILREQLEAGYASEDLPLTSEVETVITHAEIFAASRGIGAVNSVDVLICMLSYINPVKILINRTGVIYEGVLSQHYGSHVSLPVLPIEREKTILPKTWATISEPSRNKIRDKIRATIETLAIYDRYKEMHIHCNVILAVEPDNPTFLYHSAYASYMQRDFEKAAPILEQLLATAFPGNETCDSMLGFIESENGDHTRMIRIAERQQAMHGGESGFHWGMLGHHLSKQGRYEEACEPLKKAITLTPSEAAPHNDLGFAIYKLGDVMTGKAGISHSLKLDAGNFQAYHHLGVIYMETGDSHTAKKYLQQALYYNRLPLYTGARQETEALLQKLG